VATAFNLSAHGDQLNQISNITSVQNLIDRKISMIEVKEVIKEYVSLDMLCVDHPTKIKSLSSRYSSTRRAACAAGWLDGAYWLIGPG